MDFKVTARSAKHPQEMISLTEDMHRTSYRANGEWTNLGPATFETVDFRGSVFDPFNAKASTFIDCDFRRVKMKTGSLGILQGGVATVYRGCTFDGADMRGAQPRNARFERCTFRRAKLDGWWAFETEFVDCVFEGRFKGVRFAGSTELTSIDVGRQTNAFHGNDFTKADLHDVEFICGIDIHANLMPAGPEYVMLDRVVERVERARADVARWPVDAEREAALLELRILTKQTYRNQGTTFHRRDEFVPDNPAVRARLLDVLERPLG